MQLIEDQRRKRRAGITIAEVLVASCVVSLLVMADMAAVYQMRVLSAKDAEKGIISDFMQHYVELVKAIPFDQVRTNLPISGLYTGAAGTPKILLPPSGSWISLASDTNYQAFHPTLIWVTNRNPQMRVSIETSSVSGIAHDKHVSFEVQWDPPLGLGRRQTQKLDLYRVKDI